MQSTNQTDSLVTRLEKEAVIIAPLGSRSGAERWAWAGLMPEAAALKAAMEVGRHD